ncbi:MAG: hypothetical protein K2Q34_07255 [Alphaproteobacteria bacterium]|nr:hypothetical protein [Alphaproteobacteria bacterium]
MKIHTKKLAILLATTCLNTVYAMDFTDTAGSTPVVSGGSSGGYSSAWAAQEQILVRLVEIDFAGQAIVERARTADVENYESNSGALIADIYTIPDISTRNLILGYHNAKVRLCFKMENARIKEGTHEESEANSQLAEAERYLASIDHQLNLLVTNGGSLEVLVHKVSVSQDEAGRGLLETAFNSDRFDVEVGTRTNTFDSEAFRKVKEHEEAIPYQEIHEVEGLASVTSIPSAQLKRMYTFLDFFNPSFNPFTGQTNSSETGIFEIMDALRHFHGGSLVRELQELSRRIHEKAKNIRGPAAGVILLESIDTVAMAIDNLLILLNEDSPFAKAFRQDIEKVMSSFAPLQSLCSDYVGALGIQDKAFSVPEDVSQVTFALERVRIPDISKTIRHLEKISSILNSKRGTENPFQSHINKLGKFIGDDQAFLGSLETHDLSSIAAAVEADNRRVTAELPVARALVKENAEKVQRRKEELEKSPNPHDSQLSDLEPELRTAEGKVRELEGRLVSNPRWIDAVRASFEARDNFRGFHAAFMNQYHALQTPTVWESVPFEELGAFRQSLTNLNMLVNELQEFYKEAHYEVVKVAAKSGRVLDLRHAPSLVVDREAGYKEVLFPPAPPLALMDRSSHAGSGSEPGFLAPLGLKILEDGSGMSNYLRHLVDVEMIAEKTRRELGSLAK